MSLATVGQATVTSLLVPATLAKELTLWIEFVFQAK